MIVQAGNLFSVIVRSTLAPIAILTCLSLVAQILIGGFKLIHQISSDFPNQRPGALPGLPRYHQRLQAGEEILHLG
ncbi:hypothetical protein HVW75_15330 [Klebsiella pneumoniae]|nr:hypothetical protein [Klebsiella pneumoniae]